MTMSSPRPLPLASAVRSQISWTAAINGNVNSATHSIPKPNLAPVWAYVAMPDGSSSEAPVISPGPSARRYVRQPARDLGRAPLEFAAVAFFARSVPTHTPAHTLLRHSATYVHFATRVTIDGSAFILLSSAVHSKEQSMSLQGHYEQSPSEWVRDQVELYERTNGAEGNTLRDTGLPVIIVTTRGNKSG